MVVPGEEERSGERNLGRDPAEPGRSQVSLVHVPRCVGERQLVGTDGAVRELRLALTVEDFPRALRFYRDSLGLPVLQSWEQGAARGAVLGAGRATLELLSPEQAELIDRVEVGARVAGPVRVALAVADSAATAEALVSAGAERLGEPVVTPWSHRNVRLETPDGLQLTLFTVLDSQVADR